ncbi:MAG: hypothetical protein ACTSSH_02790 [Candidatus Heimdallarchaeota archaeon]
MDPLKVNVFTSFSSFSDIGMEINYDPKIPKMDQHELKKIANYYSIILNYGESKGALYGPLPVAYHTGYLLYVYTFKIKNPQVKDYRIQKNGGTVPAFLLIFFPTSAEKFTTKARDNITFDITNWLSQYETVSDINEKNLKILNSQIEAAIFKEQSQFALDEIDEATVVISKSIELLHNVVKYQNKPVKLLFSGTDELLLSLGRKSIIENNSSLVRYFKADKNKIDFKFDTIEGTILVTTPESPTTHKYLSNDLNGVLHFGNFSTEQSREDHTNELSKIIKQTSQHCAISFVISQTDEPIKIGETKIPQVLQEGVGRTISLIDLGQQKNTISTSIIEFLDKIIEIIGKK